MKKTHFFRLLRLYAVVLTFFTTIMYGCKKEKNLAPSNLILDQTASAMQDWLSKQKADSLASYSAKKLFNNADWETAHTIAVDSGKVYQIVALTSTTIFDDPTKTQQRYLVLTRQNGVIAANVYELYGNRDNIMGRGDEAIINFENQTISKFTGEITLSTWNSNFRKFKAFENGNSTRYGRLEARPTNTKAVQSTAKKVNGCIDWYYVIYECSSGNVVSATYLYTTCTVYDCDAVSSRGSKGILSVRNNCDAPVDGSGGGDPRTSGDPNRPVTSADSIAFFDKHIDSSKLNPCFNKALHILSQVQVNCIGNTIDYFTHGEAPDYKWEMQVGSTGGNNAVTTPIFDRLNKTVTTTFNSSNYSSGSDLAVARTILHESVHAFLTVRLAIDPSNTTIQYSDLVDNYYNVTHQNLNEAEHNIMVVDFISDIALILNQYALSQGYNTDLNYCLDLAWGGLTETKAFKALSQANQNRIMDTLNIEQNSTDRNGNPVSFKGSASQCP